jgi:hypothetical protein
MRSVMPIVLLMLSLNPGVAAQGAEQEAIPLGSEPVFVDSTDILLLESFPVQVVVSVRGHVPTPCHKPVWAVQDRGDTIEITLWSESDPEAICIQVLETFEVAIPLGSYEAADIDVLLNGDPIGRIEIGTPSVQNDTTLVGAGWSFGMCGGYCVADLEIEGRDLVLTGRSNMVEDSLFVNRASLTSVGQARIAAALKDVDVDTLESVYGCPDCADGGAAYLALASEGAASMHSMNFGGPPEVLTDVHQLSVAIIDDVQTCTASELVSPDPSCEPFDRN